MTDFEKMLAMFETVMDYCQYSIKKTIVTGVVTGLELNVSGMRYVFSPKSFELIETVSY